MAEDFPAPLPPTGSSPKWLGLAVQALVVLAASDRRSSSSALAEHLQLANQATMRRVMGRLVRCGLVEAREGREGGYRLRRPPEQITLAEVYAQLGIEDPLTLAVLDAFADCPLGQAMRLAFLPILREIEQARDDVWARYTVADVRALLRRAETLDN